MCLAVALTASRLGANVANYVEVNKLLYWKDEDGNDIGSGATVFDKISGNYNSHPFTEFCPNWRDHSRMYELKCVCESERENDVASIGFLRKSILLFQTSNGKVAFAFASLFVNKPLWFWSLHCNCFTLQIWLIFFRQNVWYQSEMCYKRDGTAHGFH